MNDVIDTISLEKIDRTIYAHIRKVLVAKGHLPSKQVYVTKADYLARKVFLANNLIDLQGVGASESRDKKIAHSIVINRKTLTRGEIGASQEPVYIKNGDNTFSKVINPENSFNIVYEVRLITNSTEYDRIGTQCIMSAMGVSKYLPVVGDDPWIFLTTDNILSNFNGMVDVSSTNFVERLFTFTITDIWLEDTNKLVDGIIVPLIEIGVNIGEVDGIIEVTDSIK